MIDLSAPESLGPLAIADLDVDGRQVVAYTLERIAGEKLRAFLSTLPTHLAKIAKPGAAVVWSSSMPAVASVDASGAITAMAAAIG